MGRGAASARGRTRKSEAFEGFKWPLLVRGTLKDSGGNVLGCSELSEMWKGVGGENEAGRLKGWGDVEMEDLEVDMGGEEGGSRVETVGWGTAEVGECEGCEIWPTAG